MLKEEYANREECLKDLENYNQTATEKMYYCSYWNEIKKCRYYVPCTYEFFKTWRQMILRDRQAFDRMSRCLVPSKREGGLKMCRENCDHCPYGKTERDTKFVDIDTAEYSDSFSEFFTAGETGDVLDNIIRQEIISDLHKAIATLDPKQKKIVALVAKGYSDSQIGIALGMPKSSVQYQRTCIFAYLKKMLQQM